MLSSPPSLSIYLTSTPEKALPRIAEKARQNSDYITILAHSSEEANALDHILWTYTPISFLAHGSSERNDNPQDHPIWITTTIPINYPKNIFILTHTNVDIHLLLPCEKIIVICRALEEKDKDSLSHWSKQCSNISLWEQTERGWQPRSNIWED